MIYINDINEENGLRNPEIMLDKLIKRSNWTLNTENKKK